MVPEKNVTEFFCDADADDDDRSDPYMSPPLKRAGDTINNKVVFAIIKIIIQKIKSRKHVVNSIPKLHNFFGITPYLVCLFGIVHSYGDVVITTYM